MSSVLTTTKEVDTMDEEGDDLRKIVNSLILALVLILLITATASASPGYQTAPDGEAIFKDKCSRCHTIGGGDKKGPDLLGVTQMVDQQYLIAFIDNPRQVIASGDENANALVQKYNTIMPDVGLSQDQILAVISYIDTQTVAGKTSNDASQSPTGGDPENGRALFINDVKMANGGLACISCHRIDDVGILGGGVLGPDLTEASGIYGEAGLASLLADLPLPTMQPIFVDHPLTDSERADLAAFITSQSGKPQVNSEILLLASSLAGFIAVMAFASFYWRKRLGLVRKTLVRQSQTINKDSRRRMP
jgi:mono/diheme cytochrome c family protein